MQKVGKGKQTISVKIATRGCVIIARNCITDFGTCVIIPLCLVKTCHIRVQLSQVISLLDQATCQLNLVIHDRSPVGRQNHRTVVEINGQVTIPDRKQLQFIQVLPSVKEGRTVSMNKECWGVAVAADQIFVSCFIFGEAECEVRIHDIKGKLKNILGINQDGSYLSKSPCMSASVGQMTRYLYQTFSIAQ